MVDVDDDDLPKADESPRRLVWIGGIVIVLATGWFGVGVVNGIKYATVLASIHKDPKGFDGQMVTVSGRVGDVFALGETNAFTLRQGSDTIVVMSRYRRPLPNQKVTVTGSVSMGYMDGRARPALFESAPTK